MDPMEFTESMPLLTDMTGNELEKQVNYYKTFLQSKNVPDLQRIVDYLADKTYANQIGNADAHKRLYTHYNLLWAIAQNQLVRSTFSGP
jgi:hypothetical protein